MNVCKRRDRVFVDFPVKKDSSSSNKKKLSNFMQTTLRGMAVHIRAYKMETDFLTKDI